MLLVLGGVLALGALLGFYFLSTLLAAPYPQHWHKFAEEMWIKLLLVAVPVLAAGRVRRLESAMKLALMIAAYFDCTVEEIFTLI